MKQFFIVLCLALIVLPRIAQAQAAWQSVNGIENATGFNVQVAVDAAGNTWVAGNFNGSINLGNFTLTSVGSSDVFVARINPAGTYTLAVSAGGPAFDYMYGIILDATGSPVVSGYFTATANFGTTVLTSAGAEDAFVARLSAAGVWTQAVRAGGAGAEYAQNMALAANGDIVVTGTFDGTAMVGTTRLSSAGGFDVYVARLNTAGVWTQAVRAGGPGTDSASSVALDAAGNASIAGYFSNTCVFGNIALTSAGFTDMFVAKVSPAGTWVQAVRAGGPDSDFGRSLVLNASGEVTVIGDFNGTAQFGITSLTSAGRADIYVARLSANGTWTQAVRAGGTDLDVPDGLALDAAGNVVISGFISGTATFGSTAVTSAGGRDIIVASLSSRGDWLRVAQGGGPGDDTGTDLVIAPDGLPVIVGMYMVNARLGPVLLPGARGAFVAKLAGPTLAVRSPQVEAAFTLAPNPAYRYAYLTWLEATAQPRALQIVDNLGRVVQAYTLPAHGKQLEINTQALLPGLYLVRCESTTSRLLVE